MLDQFGVHLQRARGQRLRQALQEFAQSHAIDFGLATPGMRGERIDHRVILRVLQLDVGQAGVDRVAGVQRRAGEREEQAGTARHASHQPAAAHVREQTHGDLRHRQLRNASVTTRWLAPAIRPMPPPMTMPWPQHRIGLG